MAVKLQKNLGAINGRVLCIAFLVVSLILMTVYFREGDEGPLHSAQSALSGMTLPFKFVSGGVGSGTDAVGAAAGNAAASSETLEGLRNENEALKEEVARLEEYRQEAQRLEGLLGLRDTYDFETVAARIVSRSSNAWERVITIDKGSASNITVGLPVMGPTGVIGQVISTTPVSAEIRLISDPLSGVSVLLQSSRAQGIVKGSLEGLLYMENIDADAAVQVGDVVITSGLGGSYFRGLMVGTVAKVGDTQGGASRNIVVALNENPDLLEEVLVIIQMNSEGDAAVNMQAAPEEGTEGE